ncbi:MAG: rhomboid family intramembrane serine protease [Nannocystaceae bacterium]|nr:rhomboid family intramembrane serine protease [Nannocystaceae bacterium]
MADLSRQWLATIAYLVTKTEPPARLLALGDNGAALAMADGSLATLVVLDEAGPLRPEVGERLAKIVQDNPHAHLKHVIVGGDPTEVQRMLRACQPRLSMRRAVQVFQLTPDGELWAGPNSRRDSPVGIALTAASSEQDPPDRELVAQLVRPLAPASPEEREHTEHGQQFLDRLRGAKPRAVWFVLATIVFVFGLETLWGGSELAPTLVRMGANTDASLSGEPWRLFASVLLHAGIAHALINGFVLIALGGFLERLIGPARLLVVLVASGLGGAIASALAGNAALSVGASGAIWGALGASAVFGLKPMGVIPKAVVPSIRRAAITNLVINLTVSFLPEVDLWAHLGGGIVGAALVATGVVTRGLPGSEQAPDLNKPITASRGMRITAAIAVATLLAGLGAAFISGRPWVLAGNPTSETRVFGDGPVAMTLPTYMAPTEHFDHRGLDAYSVGDILADPFTVVVVVEPHTMNAEKTRQARDEVATADPPAPPEAKTTKPWGPAAVGEHAYCAEYAYDNGLRIQMWYQVQDKVRIRVDTTWWADAPPPQLAAAKLAVASVAQ